MGHKIPGLQAQRIAKGWTKAELARKSKTTEDIITTLESEGDCEQDEVERLRQVLASGKDVSLTAFEKGVVADEAAAEVAYQKDKPKK